MRYTSLVVAITFLNVLVAGCSDTPVTQEYQQEQAEPYIFLGIPEDQSSGKGPGGLINGESLQIDDVSAVSEVNYDEYVTAKQNDTIVAEEEHNGYVYWAIKQERDIPFDNATAWITVLERYKSKFE